MTIRSKAHKFRIGMSSPMDAVAPGEDAARDLDPANAPRTQHPAGDAEGPERDLEAIRREGLSGRQLRTARRLAARRGLVVRSDFEAVQQLRDRGIDPFDRASMLEPVVPSRDDDVDPPARSAQNAAPNAPPQEPQVGDRPLQDIQRDIVRRRRRRLALLGARLLLFVGIPTALVGYYFIAVATPMYATKTEFVIQQADAGGSAGALGGLFSGTGFATSQDSIAVQSYLMSRDAMLRLDEDAGFRDYFSRRDIDPIRRLAVDASMEDAYALYRRIVEIGYDPTEGIVKMEIIAADPDVSVEYSTRLIGYAEERV